MCVHCSPFIFFFLYKYLKVLWITVSHCCIFVLLKVLLSPVKVAFSASAVRSPPFANKTFHLQSNAGSANNLGDSLQYLFLKPWGKKTTTAHHETEFIVLTWQPTVLGTWNVWLTQDLSDYYYNDEHFILFLYLFVSYFTSQLVMLCNVFYCFFVLDINCILPDSSLLFQQNWQQLNISLEGFNTSLLARQQVEENGLDFLYSWWKKKIV